MHYFQKNVTIVTVMKMKVEICCGCLNDCELAVKYHADRIELNSALELGGLTPTLTTLKNAIKVTKHQLPICCMVRPRTAGFVYTDLDMMNMFDEAKALLDNGADGIVFGFLHHDTTIDVERTKEMVELIHSYGKEAIFHKAFDECLDQEKAIQQLIACKVDRILTGGGKVSIEEGCANISKLREKYGHLIELLPGGGVRPNNITQLLEISGCDQIHMTAKQVFHDQGDYVRVDETTLKEALKQLDR